MKSTTLHSSLRFLSLLGFFATLCLASAAWARGGAPGAAPMGTIAYVRGGTQIRLIQPDGSGDRELWTEPPTQSRYGDIRELAFRPDGKQLAFSSSHENAVSFYQSDIYGIGIDGKGLHRLTNAPSPDRLAQYPKCKVKVTVVNNSSEPLAYRIVVYVAGASRPLSVMAGPGYTGSVTFDDVAVINGALQPVMAAVGGRRWPGPPLRLVPGQLNTASMTLTGRAFDMMGAYCPVWTDDGKQIAYRFGAAAGVYKVSGQGTPGTGIGMHLGGKTVSRVRAFDLGPGSIPGGGLIYTPGFNDLGEDDRSIYQTDEMGQNVKRLLHYENSGGSITQVRWLPDGSGFLFTRGEPLTFGEGANLCRFDLATRRETQLTEFNKEAVRDFAISPDGGWIVFERGQAVYNPWDKTRPALWLMRIDGRDSHLLVEDAWSPAWGK